MSLISETKQKLEAQARELDLLPKAPTSPNRPQLKLPTDDREYHDFAREAGEIIVAAFQATNDPRKLLFRRAQVPVRVNPEQKRLDEMGGQTFRTWASDHFACYRECTYNDGTTRRKIRTMSLDVATATLASDVFLAQLPEIKRLNFVRQPVFRAGGKIELLKPGFLSEQGIFTIADGAVTYDEEMTLEQARSVIDDLLSEYPLDERSKSVVLAAMLTTFCAPLLPKGARPPAFIYTANSPGAGKTMLAKFALAPLFGSAASRAFPIREELRKVLDILALEAASYCLFDNLKGKIAGEDIEAFLTSSEWEVRPLGQSIKYRVENVTTVFFTGNQARFSEDMRERSLFAELLVKEADPSERSFSRVIDDAFLGGAKVRSQICSALWAFVRYWDADGRPKAPSSMPRFEGWSAIVPAIVTHAGFADPLRKPDLHGVNEETADMRALVAAMAPAPDGGKAKYEFDELMIEVRARGLFEDLIDEHQSRRRGAPFFDEKGLPTAAARSGFGKLFVKFDTRVFVINGCAISFSLTGRGDTRRYVFERVANRAG